MFYFLGNTFLREYFELEDIPGRTFPRKCCSGNTFPNLALLFGVEQRIDLAVAFSQQEITEDIDDADADDGKPNPAHGEGVCHSAHCLLTGQLKRSGKDGGEGG